MLKVHKSRLRGSRADIERLYKCNRQSAEVWNACVEHARRQYTESGQWITQSELQQLTKRQYPLHSQSIQAVCHKYLWARDAAKAAKAKGYSCRYPYRQKQNYPTKWAKDGFTLSENGWIELSLGIWQGKRQKPIRVQVGQLPVGIIKEIEVVWDRGLWLAISYEDGQTLPKLRQQGPVAAVDPGEIHAIAAVCDNGEGLIITGRYLRSLKQLRNKKSKELQKQMARCTKGSRQWKKYHKALQKCLSKSEAQQRDALHKISKSFVGWCLEFAVKEVVIGDVEGVQRHTRRKRSKAHNQRMSQWSFGQLNEYLEYKLRAQGIQLNKINEAFSTQTCPVCPRRNKPSGRIYACRCGYRCHRDIHGASNHLSKYHYGEYRYLGTFTAKYLRIGLKPKSSRSPEAGRWMPSADLAHPAVVGSTGQKGSPSPWDEMDKLSIPGTFSPDSLKPLPLSRA